MTSPSSQPLHGKTVLITGAAHRVGKMLALAVAQAGGDVALHYAHAAEAAQQTAEELRALGARVHLLQADLTDAKAAQTLIARAWEKAGALYALVNNAAIFENLTWETTDLAAWERHLRLNLTAPFLLSQAFARRLPPEQHGRIVNILDWRALRPGADHLPYTVSKAGLAALTQSLAVAFAPRITVNGIALGAVLPPADGQPAPKVLHATPISRWATPEEVGEVLRFLLAGPAYITGEIIHLDGGRHLI
ncbi:MAG: SDR family oxidoreductase [Chloroflexi bacterium]|nr:SDR family oxidoreductase [Chloroflexota bacterium]